jgi:glycosyltransferase involved in cell wall biosynthesis
MKILLSAYACEPNKGSEPGVGWHWAIELAKMGHEVWVLTRANNRSSIEAALQSFSLPNLQFVYYDLPIWAKWWKKFKGGVYLYYILWQWGAYGVAKSLTDRVTFDFVHHITFGVFRQPSLMVFLGIPFIFGPVGGGERAPYALRKSFPIRGYIIDLLRDISNWLSSIEPITQLVYQRSHLILCKTPETLACIPKAYRDKCRLYLEIGIDPVSIDRRDLTLTPDIFPVDPPFRVLYIGRLIYWKGLHLGLKAFAQFHAKEPNSRLTVIGSGTDKEWLHNLAQQLSINDAIDWIEWMPQTEVIQFYSCHDAFLFPSLHDSSGNVVLEALSQGLPIVCLDLGGPGVIVNNSCGRVIETKAATEKFVIQAIDEALQELAHNPELLTQLRKGALTHSQEYRWNTLVDNLYSSLESQSTSSNPI